MLGGRRDPDATAWAARVVANSGTVSPTTLAAVSTFARQCKTAGIWTKLNRVNLFCGNQLAACLVPLKVGAGSATDTNVNFVGGDYTEATGLTGNGSTKYLNTGLAQSAITAASRHLSAYERVRATTTADCSIGSLTGGAQLWIIQTATPDATGVIYYSGSGTGGVAVGSGVGAGFFLGNSPSATTAELYRAGSQIVTGAAVAATPTAATSFVFAASNSGSPTNYSNATLAGYSIGTHFTAGEAATYNTIMEQFQDSLGRGVQ